MKPNTAKLLNRGQARYRDFHWGITHKKVTEIKDGILPAVLTEIGKLKSLYVRDPDGEYELALPPGCSLSFDPIHKSERIYVICPDSFRNKVRNLMKHDRARMDLNALAKAAGGRQAAYPYPKLNARPIGVATHVIYFTEKQGDGKSNYIHEFGEETAKLKFTECVPILAADDSGRLWLVGGNYTCPDPGITD